MAKKEKIAIQRDSMLEQVDAELDSAMTQLDGANQKVAELLSSYLTPEPRADGASPTEVDDDGNIVPAETAAAPPSESTEPTA